MKKTHRVKRHNNKSRRGGVLVLVLIVMSTLLLAAAASFQATYTQARVSGRSHDWSQAMAVAEAGVERALFKINSEATSVSATVTETVSDVGDFTVQITPASGVFTITSTGYIPAKQDHRLNRRVQVTALKDTDPPLFDWGIFAFGDIDISGQFDMASYNSAGDSYPQNINGAGPEGNIGVMGSIAFGSGDHDIKGEIVSDGGTTTPGNLPEYGNNWDGLDGKEVYTQETPSPIPPSEVPADELADAIVNNNNAYLEANYGPLTATPYYDPVNKTLIMTGDVTLPAGETYYLTKLSVTQNNTSLEVSGTGETKIFIDPPVPSTTFDANADFYLSNSANINAHRNSYGLPTDLIIYQTDGTVFWDNAGSVCVGLFAPEANIRVDQALEMGGAIVGDDVTVSGGTDFYYDTELGKPRDGGDGAAVLSWIELPPL